MQCEEEDKCTIDVALVAEDTYAKEDMRRRHTYEEEETCFSKFRPTFLGFFVPDEAKVHEHFGVRTRQHCRRFPVAQGSCRQVQQVSK